MPRECCGADTGGRLSRHAGTRPQLQNNDSAASYPLTIDPSFAQQAYLKASNTGFGDDFGFSAAISGDTLVVSAIDEGSFATGVDGDQDNNSVAQAGAAYVFIRSGMTWSQQAYLKASNTNGGDLFGWSVAISGDTVVVGAIGEDSNATGIDGDQSDNSLFGAGAAYVFVTSSEFKINAGLNDAWFNLATAGQGFFFVVFPDIELFFLSWFTFDIERPDESIEAILGEPGHRWVTAFGTWEGNTVSLIIELTSGGVFDSPEPPIDPQVEYGTITIVFHDCNSATLTYDITSLGLMGTIELTRLTDDNVALCEELNTQ